MFITIIVILFAVFILIGCYLQYGKMSEIKTFDQRDKIQENMKKYSDNLPEFLIRQREFMHISEAEHKNQLLMFRNPLKLYPVYYSDTKK